MTAGFSSLAKGGKLAAMAPRLAQGAVELKLGQLTPDAARYAAVKKASGAAIGAVYGEGAVDHDQTSTVAEIGQQLLAASAGAALGAAAPGVAAKAGPAVKALFNRASDAYAVGTRGTKFANFSYARDVAASSFDKISNIAEYIRQGRFQALEGLSPAERLKAAEVMGELKTEFLKRRNVIMESAERAVKDGAPPVDNAYIAKVSKVVTDEMEKDFLPAILEREKGNVADAVVKWGEHNDDVMAKLNESVYGADAKKALAEAPKDFRERVTKTVEGGSTFKENPLDSIRDARTPAERVDATAFLDRSDWAGVGGRAKSDAIRAESKAMLAAGHPIESTPAWKWVQKVDAQKGVQSAEEMGARVADVVHGGQEAVQDLGPKVAKVEEHVPVFGIKWHIDDVYSKKAMEDADHLIEMSGKIHGAKREVRSDAASALAHADFEESCGRKFAGEGAGAADKQAFESMHARARDATYGAYSERFANKFLDAREIEAVNLMKEYGATSAKQTGVKAAETLLGGYDKLSNFIKANMLYFSTSWVKNNYFDNLAKAYVETGMHGMIDAATMGKFQSGLSKDVLDLYGNKMNRVYEHADMQDMLKRGVLDNPMFKSIDDKATRSFLFSPQQIAEGGKAGLWDKVTSKLTNNPYSRGVASAGSFMEGTARAATYIHAKDAILASPKFKNAGAKEIALAKDMAADLVKKTFFDYGDVTHFEKAVFGRLVPFYSFYSKNLPYWTKAIVDPERAGRAVGVEKIFQNVGKDPSRQDQQGMGPYVADNAPRKLRVDKDGSKVYAIRPSSSMADAVKMWDLRPGSVLSQLVDKGSPSIKTAAELLSGHDTFEGGPLFPSAIKKAQEAEGKGNPEGKKYLFSRGFKHELYKAAIDKVFGPGTTRNMIENVVGVRGVGDKGGNPYTTSDMDVALDKIYSTIWPKGVIDQVAGSVGKVYVGKTDAVQALMDRMLPIQEVKISPDYERMVRQRNAKANGGQ